MVKTEESPAYRMRQKAGNRHAARFSPPMQRLNLASERINTLLQSDIRTHAL